MLMPQPTNLRVERFAPAKSRALFLRATLLFLLGLFGLSISGCSSERADEATGTSTERLGCDADDASCLRGGAPRPHWSEQPDRTPPEFEMSDAGAPKQTGAVQIKACDPASLGKLPTPEGGNPHPKGADLQNPSTNFHVLQSLQLLSSAFSKLASASNKFATSAVDGEENGKCICKPTSVTCSNAALIKENVDKTYCGMYCDPTNPTPVACSSGVLAWVANDVFKNNEGKAKWALKTVGVLDKLPKDLTDPNSDFQKSLSAIGGSLDDVEHLVALFQCYVDLFTEGYHLGSYSDQRPDLHMCVPYAGHGAYASLGDSSSGQWAIGGRYTSANLSAKNRAQMRTGGFGVTAFGKTLSVLPGIEFNMQIDGYKAFDKRAPLGHPELAWGGAGVSVNAANKMDIFDLVDNKMVTSLAGGDGKLSAADWIVATFRPFDYTPAGYARATWPRSEAMSVDPWEGQEASVIGAALNLDVHIKPINKELGTYTLYPGITMTPYFKLNAGVKWQDEAYSMRTRLQNALNKNATTKVDISDFDRNMHPFQAPDVTSEAGTTVSVQPEIGANVTAGIKVSKFATIGVTASIGLSVDLKPGGSGGVADLNRALEQALVSSNPPDGLECKPTWSFKDSSYCSNKVLPGSSTYLACAASDAHNSCCLTFSDNAHLCLDDWSGVTQATCTPTKINAATLGDFVPPSVYNVVKAKLSKTYTAKWSANRSCDECVADGTCPNAIRTPNFPSISSCEKTGYCCTGSAHIVAGAQRQYGLVDQTGAQARFQGLYNGAVYDPLSNMLFVADAYAVRRVNLSSGAVATVAGGTVPGNADGVGTAARFKSIVGLALEASRYLYVSDNQDRSIRKIDLVTNQVSTLRPYNAASLPEGLSFVNGALYVADAVTCTIDRIDPNTGGKLTFAGSAGACGATDGVGTAARLGGVLGLTYDGHGALYFTDYLNYNAPSQGPEVMRLRRVDLTSAQVTTVAGHSAYSVVDGYGLQAIFNNPSSLAADFSGNIYVLDGVAVRKFEPSSSYVSTILSSSSPTQSLEGATNQVLYTYPSALAIDNAGNILLGDGQESVLRMFDLGCDQAVPGSVTYDVHENQCQGQFTPYRCVTETKPTATGWAGPGCHPLHAGFQSACGCTANVDCAAGESCDIPTGQCMRGGQAQACTCDPTQGGSACGSGRSCDNGACAKTCTYATSTAATICGPNLECSPKGQCVPHGVVPFAEQIAWGVKHPDPAQPTHAIASYAMSEMQLIAALQASIKIGLKVKLFKKQREFSIFKWKDAFDLGSIEKAKFQPGLEATYQWDSSPLGLVTNYEPAQVTRYSSTGQSTQSFLDWCKPVMAADAVDPLPISLQDITKSLTDTVSFGFDVGRAIYEGQSVCIQGKKMLDLLQDPSAVQSTFANGTCVYVGPDSGTRGATSFNCQQTHLNTLRLWGCLDVNRSANSQAMARLYPAAVTKTSTPTLDVSKMLIAPNGDFDDSNFAVSPAQVDPWLDEVEACFNDHFEQTVPCTCTVDADCTGGPGQTCTGGQCRDSNQMIAQCPVVKSAVVAGLCCGDGVLEGSEQCDDGNTKSGDGCSKSCTSEGRGACCQAAGCTDLGSNGINTAADCRAAGGSAVLGPNCAQVQQCGYEPTGSCQLAGDCLTPVTRSQCTASGGTFSQGKTCAACATVPSNVSTWYPFDETSGTVVHDVASGGSAQLTTGVTHATGVVNGDLGIPVNQSITAPGSSALDIGTQDFTISAWVKRTNVTGTIAEKRQTDGSTTAVGYLFSVYNNAFLVQLGNAAGYSTYLSPAMPALADNKFHLITLSVTRADTQGGRLYVDGALAWRFNPTARAGSLNTSASLTLGHGLDQPSLGGELDEVMLWNRALSASEAAQLLKGRDQGYCH